MIRGGGGGGGDGRGRGRGRHPYGRGGGRGGEFEDRDRRPAPPSRYLWVGNLGSHVTEQIIADQFMRFGELDSVVHIAGRSYAFVNFVREDAAAAALRALKGSSVIGAPMRVEFTKPDRLPRDDKHSTYKGGRYSTEREPVLHRDLRSQHADPGRPYDNSRGDKNSEPSEILWIGFPVSLNVDEVVLRRAFSPFGEIEKITAFPGRSYAFVQYRSVVAACRAKEALQGKLFDNPRVHIFFSRTGPTTGEKDRNSGNISSPSPFPSNFHPGPSGKDVEPFWRRRNFDTAIEEFDMPAPGFPPHMSRISREPDINLSVPNFAGPGASFEHIRFQGVGSERRIMENAPGHEIIPAVEMRAPIKRPQRTPFENSWESENDSLPSAKKLKTDSFYDSELPEYPLFDTVQENRGTHHVYNRNVDSVPFGYQGGPDSSMNITRPHLESDNHWKTSDGFKPGPGPLTLNPATLERINAEPHEPSLMEEWKWEGTIAKSGKPVCRARCFPVGKELDFMLPEFLNCTARTDINMLAKHYYEAANTWVVFFVAETDADIVFYNEFMHVLEDKQRAAVAKLDENLTLFLVPPSEFSEQVLKVPGKLSISGVILQFKQHHPLEEMESKRPFGVHGPTDGGMYREDSSFQGPTSPDLQSVSQCHSYFSSSSALVAPVISSFPAPPKPSDNVSYLGRVPQLEKDPEFHGETRHNQLQHQDPMEFSNWSNNMHPSSTARTFPPPAPIAASHSYDNSSMEEYPAANFRDPKGTTSTNYAPDFVGTQPSRKFPTQQDSNLQASPSLQVHLQPEQLAQLAALLAQQRQMGKEAIPSTNVSDPSLSQNQSLPPQVSRPSGSVAPQINQMQQLQQHSLTALSSQFSHPQELHQPSSVSASEVNPGRQLPQLESSNSAGQYMGNSGHQSNQEAFSSTQEDMEADPQRRLQATLQLAAALLQQIQQQANTADQR